MRRDSCVLCDGNLVEFLRIENMPIYMGVSEKFSQGCDDMIFGECSSCGLVQNMNLIDPSLVYMENHNKDIVGQIWNQHYEDLSRFILENSVGENILEIGDPSAKIAYRIMSEFKNWVIIEPNTDLESEKNLTVIKRFFNGMNPTSLKFSTIVHSHVLEHIYDPIKFLKDCYEILEDGGVILFSIPNIKWLLENNALPTGILHFEHTYLITVDNVELFLQRSGFDLVKLEKYKNHSLFVKAVKSTQKNENIKFSNFKYKEKLLNLYNYYKIKINQINSSIGDQEYYLYSAHINSQYLLNNGISKNIIYLLDSSNSKIGKKLFGYDYDVKSPNELTNQKNPIVVVSHMGSYVEEISRNILEINPNTLIL